MDNKNIDKYSAVPLQIENTKDVDHLDLEYNLIRKNYIYNTILLVSNIFFPLITFSYIARILGPEGIGKISFALTFVGYFIIIANLGMPLYGLREIARVRNNKDELNNTFSELFSINFYAMILTSVVYLFCIFFIPRFQQDSILFLIAGISLFLSIFQFQWFFQGLENYKFITLTNVLSQFLTLVATLLFVKSSHDYLLYISLIIIFLLLTSILNIIYSKKFIIFNFEKITSFSHLKPIFTLFSVTLAISVYTSLDRLILGFLAGDIYLGYYSPAIQLVKIVTSIITSLGTVLTPRLAYYVKNNFEKEFLTISQLSLNFVLWLSFPAMVGLFLLAPDTIFIFAGNKFNDSVLTLQIMVPIIFLIGVNNFLGIQLLIPNNEDKKVLAATIIGLLTSLILNILLIPEFKEFGTAFATLISEFLVTAVEFVLSLKYINFRILSKNLIYYIIGATFVGIVTIFLKTSITSPYLTIILVVPAGIIIYTGFLLLIKEEITYKIFKTIKNNFFVFSGS